MVLGALVLGLVLFLALDARRRALSAPAVRAPRIEAVSVAPPPALYIPPEPVLPTYMPPSPGAVLPVAPMPAPPPKAQVVQPAPQVAQLPGSGTFAQPQAVAPQRPARITTEPAVVIDSTSPKGSVAQGGGAAPGSDEDPLGTEKVAGARAGAGVLANRSTTVPQGTLIPAVLETALESTSPGLARALVSHDIRGFDGARILIPRGSRLIGEYGIKTQSGQNRMLVNWIRLIRPDGATIAIGSPAGDPVGRAGIRARVNSHFFERFSGAILQSALNVGVNLASRSANSPVVVALPGSLQGAVQSVAPTSQTIQPTLAVKAATSISIFVARDLDFTGVETR